eukprot:9752498-Alexandrium_andersonii.AAC.1
MAGAATCGQKAAVYIIRAAKRGELRRAALLDELLGGVWRVELFDARRASRRHVAEELLLHEDAAVGDPLALPLVQ